MSHFLAKVASAQANEEKWVETSSDIIKLLRPRGLGSVHGIPCEHFAYKGVLVCEYGKSEALEEKFNGSLNVIKHGVSEAKVVSGDSAG